MRRTDVFFGLFVGAIVGITTWLGGANASLSNIAIGVVVAGIASAVVSSLMRRP